MDRLAIISREEGKMTENSLHTGGSGVKRTKSFKDKIQDYHGTIKDGIERTKSLFQDVRQDEATKRANLLSTQKLLDFRQRQRDYRLAIDHLAAEYQSGKESSFIMRYGKMKLMVKRILMQENELSKATAGGEGPDADNKGTPGTQRHANGNNGQPNNGTASNPADLLPSGKVHKDVQAKLQKLEGMSRQEIVEDTKKMDDEIAEIGARLAHVRASIQRLEEEYSEAKRFAPWDRYMMMKKMIKQFLACKNALSTM